MGYEKAAREEYQSRKENIPSSNGTISGMLNKTKVFAEQLKYLDEDLAKLGNEYILDNNISHQEIEKIKKINHSLISEFKKELAE